MTVYVESNFVLEQALQQEQSDSCDAIVNLAASGDISLVIPAFSLAEPHQALALKEKARNRLSNELQQQLSELGRSKPYRGVPDEFSALAGLLIRSGVLYNGYGRRPKATPRSDGGAAELALQTVGDQPRTAPDRVWE